MEKPPHDSIYLDEEPLRKAIVKGYFGEKKAPLEPAPLIAHLRDLLSGPPDGAGEPESYYFEIDPDGTVQAFLRGIEEEMPGLAILIAEPLLQAAEDYLADRRKEIAPNLAVFISSLAGSIAVRADISESEAGALLAGLLIAIGRLGPSRVRRIFFSSLEPRK